jgi:hypothetical protein
VAKVDPAWLLSTGAVTQVCKGDSDMTKRTREVGRVQVGKVFGSLTVVEVYQKLTPKPRLYAVCECSCGLHNCKRTVHLRHDAIGRKLLTCGARDSAASRVLPGTRFGFLEVISVDGENATCVCHCGDPSCKQTTTPKVCHLIGGKSTSCGCGSTRRKWKSSATSPNTYRSWEHMIDRCYNEKHPHYERYGGRGIVVCDRWRKSFDAFLEDMGERPDNKTIDRINNDMGYDPGNCRWSTMQEQNRNKSNGTTLEHQGQSMSVTEWAEKLDIPRQVIFGRLKVGWTTERALTTPVRFRRWAKRPEALTPEL